MRCQIVYYLTMEKPAAPSVEPLGRQLVFTAKAMREAFEDALTAAGGSLGSWIVLSALSDVGCMNQAALATHVHLEGATITHHVDRLEAAGLVRRQLDPNDRRVRRLELTHAGTELHTRLLAAVIELQQHVLAGLDGSERAALQKTLDTIQANLATLATPTPGGLRSAG
jgi:MarR family transcriptional regulator, transcriptional regulator for hemolysin